MVRSSVVFHDPEGPRRATSSPEGTVRLTSFSAAKWPKSFVTLRTSMLMLHLPLNERLDDQGHQRQERQERGDGEGGRGVVLIVEDFNMERDRGGPPADVAGHHRNRAELAHRPRVAEDDRSEQRPLDVGDG